MFWKPPSFGQVIQFFGSVFNHTAKPQLIYTAGKNLLSWDSYARFSWGYINGLLTARPHDIL